MSDTFCVTINSCKENGDKATVGFVVATAALAPVKTPSSFSVPTAFGRRSRKKRPKLSKAGLSSRSQN